MSEVVESPLKVAVIAWPGMDLTDFAGPCEVLSHARDADRKLLCSLIVASDHDESITSQRVKVGRDIDTDTLIRRIDDVDLLIVPGGSGFTADHIPDVPEIVRAIDAFSKLPPRDTSRGPRTLMSVCAGVFWLARAGLLAGRHATAHYGALNHLQKCADRHGHGTKVVRQHYVDCGLDEAKGMHTIVSGGIASGYDATMYFLEVKFGPEIAQKAQFTIDYQWRKEMTPFGYFV